MPRPKGSKNRTSAALSIDEKIAALEKELEALRETVAAKEAELKKLQDTRNEALVHDLMDAIACSGKSITEVIGMVKGEQPEEAKPEA